MRTYNAGIRGVRHPGAVRSMHTLRVVDAGGRGVRTAGGVGAVVAVRVESGVSRVGDTGVVGAVGALRGLVVLVRVDSLLDLVHDARHVGWFVIGEMLSSY